MFRSKSGHFAMALVALIAAGESYGTNISNVTRLDTNLRLPVLCLRQRYVFIIDIVRLHYLASPLSKALHSGWRLRHDYTAVTRRKPWRSPAVEYNKERPYDNTSLCYVQAYCQTPNVFRSGTNRPLLTSACRCIDGPQIATTTGEVSRGGRRDVTQMK